MANIVTPQDFGALGDGIADDTAAFQAALDSRDALYIPAGIYKVTTLRLKSAKKIFGAGHESVIKCYPTAPNSIGLLLKWDTSIAPAVIQAHLSSFSILPGNANLGNALAIDCTENVPAANVYCSVFENLRLLSAGNGLFIACGTNGFFNSTIRNNLIENGIYLDRCGDSVIIAENTLFGNSNGITIATMVSGSANLTIKDNNITNSGYSIFIGDNALNVDICNNQCERVSAGQPVAIAVASNTAIPARNVRIVGNNINGHSYASAGLIYLVNTNNAYIDYNTCSSNIGAPYLAIQAGCVNTRVGGGNFTVLSVSNSGTNTKFLA